MDEVVGIVLIHLDLFQDHAFFPRDVLGIENRVQHQIAEDIDGHRQMFVQHLDVEADGFFSRKRVHVAADRINLAGNLLGRAGGGALKHHVLGKMGYTVHLRGFVARSGLHPDTN